MQKPKDIRNLPNSSNHFTSKLCILEPPSLSVPMPRVFTSSRTALLLFLFIASILTPSAAWSQYDHKQKPEDMSNQSLLTFIKENSLSKALPHLLEMIKRLEGDEESNDSTENLLARCYYEVSRFHYNNFVDKGSKDSGSKSIDYAQKIRKRVPESSYAPMALQFEINIQQLDQNWDDMRKALEVGLNGIKSNIYPNSYKAGWLEDICYSFAMERLWKEGRPWFIQAYTDIMSSRKLKTQAAIYLIQSYETTEEPEKALPFIPELNSAKDERYDPNLNLSLFKLGNQFSDKEEYSNANHMYFICLTIEIIIDFNEKRLEGLIARSRWFKQRDINVPIELKDEIASSKAYIKALRQQPSYTGPLKYHRARNLERMGRVFDAYFAYRRLIYEHPEHPSAELFHYSAFNQADAIGYTEDVFELGEAYLANPEYGVYRKETMVKLVSNYFKIENYDRVHAIGKDFVRDYPLHRYGVSIVHFMGFGYLRQGRLEENRTVLGGFLDEHPDAEMAQSAHYWVGMTEIIEQEFEAAIPHFDSIINKYPDGNFYMEARFRRGVCDFGIGDYDAAGPRFEKWVEDYPESHLRGEAEVFLGDIDAYYAKIEEALAHYATTETFTSKMNLIDHAYFESVRLLEVNERFDEMLALLNQYMERFQDTGNLTRALFQIGQAYENSGAPEKMIETYYDAIVKYGNNMNAEGVDEIFESVSEKYTRLDAYYDSTLEFIARLLEDEAFRLELADDRNKLHVFRLQNPDVEEDVIDNILRKSELREGLGTRPIPLTEEEVLAGAVQQYDTTILPAAREYLENYVSEFEEKQSRMPTKTPEEKFRELYAKAQAESERTLELRLLAAFDSLGLKAPGQTKLTINDFPDASPSTLAWMAESLMEEDPELSKLAINAVLTGYPDSLAIPDTMRTQAKFAYMEGDLNGSIKILDEMRERFPTWDEAPAITLRAARLKYELEEYNEALERYLEVLQIRDWRGEAWAEACYQIGRCYEATGEDLKAHGFYERTYISYRQFQEWAGKAYYRDGLLLEQMNEQENAKSVYEAYLNLPNAKELADYDAVKKRHETL